MEQKTKLNIYLPKTTRNKRAISSVKEKIIFCHLMITKASKGNSSVKNTNMIATKKKKTETFVESKNFTKKYIYLMDRFQYSVRSNLNRCTNFIHKNKKK
jgi:hypothetical protein